MSLRKPLGNRSDLMVLAMTTADDGVGGSNSCSFFVVLQTKWCFFGFAKSKAINFIFKDYFNRSICNFRRLARQKTIQILSSSKFKSSLQHAGTRFNSKKSLHANITE